MTWNSSDDQRSDVDWSRTDLTWSRADWKRNRFGWKQSDFKRFGYDLSRTLRAETNGKRIVVNWKRNAAMCNGADLTGGQRQSEANKGRGLGVTG